MLKFFCYNFTDEKSTSQIMEDIQKLINETKQYEREEDIMLFVFVPTVSLEAVLNSFERKYVKISAQEYSTRENPPVIGQLTLSKLKSLKTDMVISGMADSRFYSGETDGLVRDKIEAALKLGFKGMIGVGETEQSVKDGTSDELIERQVKTACSKIPYEAHYRIGIVYRPLWAFGKNAKPSERQYTIDKISLIKKAADDALPGFPIQMPVFYGGKLTAGEAKELILGGIIDGVFVDSVTTGTDEFISLINSCCDADEY